MPISEELRLEQPKESRDIRIRKLFGELGGSMTTNEFARECIDQGIWEEYELDRIQLQGVQSEVRRALKVSDAAGLPFAGQTTEREDGGTAQVWKQRAFWIFEDYELNIRDLVTQRDVLNKEAWDLANECQTRYGRAPDITPIEDRQS